MLKLVLVTIACLLCVSAHTHDPSDVATLSPSVMFEDVSMLAVKWVTNLYHYLMEFMEMAIRSLRLFASLYTEDNLLYVRRLISIALRFGTWLSDVVPQNPSEGYTRILNYLFPTPNLAKNANVYDPLYEVLNLRRPGGHSEHRSNSIENEVLSLDTLINAGTRKTTTTMKPPSKTTRKPQASMDELDLKTPFK